MVDLKKVVKSIRKGPFLILFLLGVGCGLEGDSGLSGDPSQSITASDFHNLESVVDRPGMVLDRTGDTGAVSGHDFGESYDGKDFAPGEVLVKFKEGVSPLKKEKYHKEAKTKKISEIPRLKVHRVKSEEGESTKTLLNRYRKNPDVEYAEPNIILRSQFIPNDPRFVELWGFNNTGQTGGSQDADIDAPEAWEVETGNAGVVVAVIDSGVDYNHPDLASNIWVNPGEIPGNGNDDDGNGYVDDVRGWDFVNNDPDPMDDHGHGTHVAGIIGAVGNNGVGVAGVSFQSKIMPLKFLNIAGNGLSSDAASAVIYSADNGAKISNNSWGCFLSSDCFSQTLESAIAYADAQGGLFVGASGNNNSNNDVEMAYPCNSLHPNVVCVGATDDFDQKAVFTFGGSNFGATTVDLAAPGKEILSVVPTGTCSLCDITGYLVASGTSMAAPHAAGAAALVTSKYPNLDGEGIKGILMGSVDPIPDFAGLSLTGGRLNVRKALDSNFTLVSVPEIQRVLIGGSAVYDLNIFSLNNFNEPVTLTLHSPDPTITGVVSLNPVTPPVNGTGSASITVFTTGATAKGKYVLTITGTDPFGETHSAFITVHVVEPDFFISVNSTSQYIQPGQSAEYVLRLNSIDGYEGTVMLEMTTSDPEISGIISPNRVMLPADGFATAVLTVFTTFSALPENHFLTIQGTDKLISRSTTVDLDLGMRNEPGLAWADPYNGPNNGIESAKKIRADFSGNVYVMGPSCQDPNDTDSSCNSNNWNYETVKYDSNGTRLWARSYDNGGRDVPFDMDIDPLGNVYVTGVSTYRTTEFTTLKYAPDGTLLCEARYSGGHEPRGVAADSVGNFYVGGFQNGFPRNFVFLKYDSVCNLLWEAKAASGSIIYPYAMELDAFGNTYMTGYNATGIGDENYYTVKVNPIGQVLWTVQYDGGGRDFARGIGVDDAGNVYVTGYSSNGKNVDYATVKYDPEGNQVWVVRYDNGGGDFVDPVNFLTDILGGSLTVDGFGNSYVTGASSNGLNNDYATVKYDSNGNQLWVGRYDNKDNDLAKGIALDSLGNVYVAGWSWNGSNWDFATVKYDSSGREEWVKTYDGGTGERARAIALDSSGNIFVAGDVNNGMNDDFLTLKYVPVDTLPTSGSDLAISITDNPDPVLAGDRLTYTMTGINNGPDAAVGSVTISPSLTVNPVGISSNKGSCSIRVADGCPTCPLYFASCTFQDMAVGETVGVNYQILASAETTRNTASISSPDVNDPVLSNNSATEFTEVLGIGTTTSTTSTTSTSTTTTTLPSAYKLTTFTNYLFADPPPGEIIGAGTPAAIACPPGYKCYLVSPGVTLTLTAVSFSGYEFSEWGNDCAGQGNPCIFIMDFNKVVSANFVPVSTTSTTSTTSTSTTTTSTTSTTIGGGGVTRPTIVRPPRPPRPTVVRPSRPTVR